MIFLIAALICGSAFSIIFKLCQRHGIDRQQVILFNYVAGVIVSIIPVAAGVASGTAPLADYILPLPTMLLTLVMGLLFVGGFVAMDLATLNGGVALASIMARSALIIPVTLSWLFLGQKEPSWLVMAMFVTAMIMLVFPDKKKREQQKAMRSQRSGGASAATLSLIFVFLVYGLVDFSFKLVQSNVASLNADNPVRQSAQMTALTITIFLMAGIIAYLICLAKGSFRKSPLDARTVIIGLLMGCANTACTKCMLQALVTIPTEIFYPLYNIGIVVISAFVGIIFFKERIRPMQLVGLVLAAVAIFMSFR